MLPQIQNFITTVVLATINTIPTITSHQDQDVDLEEYYYKLQLCGYSTQMLKVEQR
jgi:hypothetical protein